MELKFAKTRKGKLIFAFFIVMTVFAVMLPITAFSLAESDLERLTDPDVMRMVHKVGYFESLGRKILWQILIWLAQLVDYFEKAVDQITNYNLYNLIKDQFDINAVAYPIAWAAASVAIIFVAVLLIYNADKTRLTDFARGIVTSIILILALPAMVSALSELRSQGVEYVKETTGQETGSDSEGVYYKETLGQKTLAPYVYYTVDSVKNDTKTSIKGISTWGGKTTAASGYTPSEIYKMDINEKLPYDTLQYYISDVEEYPVGVQHKYSEINYEIRRELCGVSSMYNDWMEMRDGKDPDDKPKVEFAPSITLPNGMQIRQSTQSYSRYLFSTGNEWTETYEYFICTRAADYVEAYLINYGVDVSSLNLYNTIINAYSLSNGLKKLDTCFINVDGREFSIMEYLNAKNNEKLAEREIKYVGTGQIKELLDDTEYYSKSELEQVWLNIISWGDPLEHVYKYDFDFLWAFISLFILLIALFFAGLKLAGLLYDILFAQIVVPIIVASDMNSSGKAKAAVQNLINTFLIFIIVNLLLRLYILILGSIHTATDLNFLAKIILILAGAKFVIDGPDIVTKILGIDAGVKSGLATLMGVRTAVQMGTGAVRTAKNAAKNVGGKAAHAGSSVANRTGGAVGGALSGFVGGAVGGGSATEGAKGLKGAMRGGLNTVGGAVGGAFAGGAKGAMNGTNKDTLAKGFNTGKSAGETLTSPIGSHKGSDNSGGNSGESSSSGSGSGTADNGSSGGGTSGASNESSVSNSTSHISSDSSAKSVGGAFANNNANVVKGEKGDKGDKGDKGNDGLQGMQGNRGETGEKGKDAENNAQSGSVNNGSAFSGTWADQQRTAESNSSSWAQQTRSAESSSPTFAEQQHRAEQPTYHAPAPSAPSAPAQPSEPKNHDKK